MVKPGLVAFIILPRNSAKSEGKPESKQSKRAERAKLEAMAGETIRVTASCGHRVQPPFLPSSRRFCFLASAQPRGALASGFLGAGLRLRSRSKLTASQEHRRKLSVVAMAGDGEIFILFLVYVLIP